MITAMLLAAGFSHVVHSRIAEAVRRAEKVEIAVVLSEPQWPKVFGAINGWERLPRAARVRLAAKLVPALHTTAFVRPINTADLMVPYRLQTGELKHIGFGLHIQQDVFLSGGRAAFAISRLIGDENLPVLDGGLTAGEWNKRALAIEAKVKAFAKGPGKPPVEVHQIRSWSAPHIHPAVNGLLATRDLLAPSRDAWRTLKIISLLEEREVNEFMTSPKWPRVHEISHDWRGRDREPQARMAERLVPFLRDTTRVAVEDADNLLLPNRIASGNLKASPNRIFNAGHDVFLKGGRAAFGLSDLHTSMKPQNLHGGLTVDEWNKRAEGIEKRVEKFVEENKPVK